ncbi:hypothetical protein, unlikely [Trypanosoma congolense IL3000]|uniref:Uncharacterized protein n=1 Tax=Trypanosoma congolense (strain IL3000) TaxID=1068625 RepID=F9WBI5_TRYCI|nr:hypothetical protein, unlikely [Trypanosoma congolense IL3000]
MEPTEVSEEEVELRYERAMLLSERDFLRREVDSTASVQARVTTARKGDAEKDSELLRMYLSGLLGGNLQARRKAETNMREKVKAKRAHLVELRRIFGELQKEAMQVRDRCVAYTA